jgi:hypothetical protein
LSTTDEDGGSITSQEAGKSGAAEGNIEMGDTSAKSMKISNSAKLEKAFQDMLNNRRKNDTP